MRYLKVQEFNEVECDQAASVNKLLKQHGDNIHSVTSLYNTVLGGVVYIVTYWVEEVTKPEPSIKSDWSIEECFLQLRHNKDYHLGLGDIRLTVGVQEQIRDLINQFYTKR